MNKLMIATDIHGSAYWAGRVAEEFEKSGADILVVLGDVYNHGPRNPFPQDYAPMRVAEKLNGIADRLLVVKGNCDSEVDQMISDFSFVSESVLFEFGRRLFFTHGHIHNKDNLPSLSAGDALFYGHFHVNEITDVNGVTAVNVGSCSLPKDGKHSYCLVDEQGVRLVQFDGGVVAEKKF